jgi:hypothetical protein
MRSSILLAGALALSLAPLACSSSASNDGSATGDDQNEVSLPQSEALMKYLEKVFAEGDIDTPDDATAQSALARLDTAVGAKNVEALKSQTADDLGDPETQVVRVTRADGKVAFLSFKSFGNDDGSATLGLVNVEDADGSVRTFAERDLADGKGVDDYSAGQVVSTLYTIDGSGLHKVNNVVDTPSTDLEPDTATAQAFAGLHLSDESFGSPKMCSFCKGVVTAIKASQPVLVFLISHHFFTAACIGAAAAAGGATAVAAAPTVVGEAAVPEAAAAGYRGCRIVMAGVAALIAASVTMPATDDDPGKVKYCNKVSSFIPGAHAWCADHGPDTCSLSLVHAPTNPADQCIAIARCAHDSKCPDAQNFCNGLFFGDAQPAKDGRALCAKVDAVSCAGTIQSDNDLKAACADLTR